jgi:transcriptional regulator with XRE-family HTH domain
MNGLPTTDSENRFVEWMEEEIARRGWTQAELAKRAGVFQSAIGGIMSREKALSALQARRIAQALGMSQHRLFVLAQLIDDEGSTDDASLVEIARSLARMDAMARRRLVRIAEVLAAEVADVPGGRDEDMAGGGKAQAGGQAGRSMRGSHRGG